MSDKQEIKVGQRWVTRGGEIVRVLDVSPDLATSVTVRGNGNPYSVFPDGKFTLGHHDADLISLAPSTVKRELALYRCGTHMDVFEAQDERVMDLSEGWRIISETVTIEFTLLPGESAE
jgi:hypothetical protein